MSDISPIEQRKNGVRRFWDEVFNKGNFEALQAMAPGYQYNGSTQDNAAFIKWVRDTRESLPDLHIVIDEILAEDTKVALRWHMRGTAKGDERYPAGMKVEWVGTNILVHHPVTGLCISNDQNGHVLLTPADGRAISRDANAIYASPGSKTANSAVGS